MKKQIISVLTTAIMIGILSTSQTFADAIPENYYNLSEGSFREWQIDTTGYSTGEVFEFPTAIYGDLYYKVSGENRAMLCTPDGEIVTYEQIKGHYTIGKDFSEEISTETQKEASTETQKETSTETQKETSTETQKEVSNNTSLLSSGDPTLGRLIGDISSGNHPNAPYAESEIIVPRPFKSRFAPIQKATSSTNFTDIQGHWAEQSMKRFAAEGFLAGYSDGTFKPDAPITYGELATVFCRLNPKPIRFDDIMQYDLINIFKHKDTKAWYYPSLLVADEAGLWGNNVKLSYEAGFMSNNKRPNTIYGQLDAEDSASRQYTALFLANLLESKDSDNTVPLNYKDNSNINANSDGDIPNAIKRLINNGIINGYPDNTFRPDNPVTRAELVVMLTKILDTYQWDMNTISDNLYGNYKQFFWEQDDELMKLVNNARVAEGIEPVTYNADLQALCEVKMIDKTINGFDSFGSAHTCSYGTMEEMRKSFGFSTYIGENVAAAIATPDKQPQTFAEKIHKVLTNSEGHRLNYMNPKHKYGGFSLGECYGFESFSPNK